MSSHSQPQRFALTWNDYRSSLVSAFDSLRGEGEFVDVTLAAAAAAADDGAEGGGGVGGRRFGAHKVLLSACSPYFRSLLRGCSPLQHPIVILRETSAADLEAILEFVYHGEVSVEEAQLESFLRSARVLQISGLTETRGSNAAISAEDEAGGALSPPPESEGVSNHSRGRKRKKGASSGTPLNKGKRGRRAAVDSRDQRQQEEEAEEEAVKHEEGGSEALVLLEEESYAEANFTTEASDGIDGGTLPPPTMQEIAGRGVGEGGLACTVCGKAFRTKNALLDHTKVHWGKTECELCGKVFSTEGNKKRHRAQVHGLDSEEQD